MPGQADFAARVPAQRCALNSSSSSYSGLSSTLPALPEASEEILAFVPHSHWTFSIPLAVRRLANIPDLFLSITGNRVIRNIDESDCVGDLYKREAFRTVQTT